MPFRVSLLVWSRVFHLHGRWAINYGFTAVRGFTAPNLSRSFRDLGHDSINKVEAVMKELRQDEFKSEEDGD